MKGQMTVENMMFLLISIAVAGGFFVFIINTTAGGLSSAEDVVVYPEQPPQILAFECFTEHANLIVETETLSGDVDFRIQDFNGTIANDSSVYVNLTEYGNISVKAPMVSGESYSGRFYTPKWSISDTCTAKP